MKFIRLIFLCLLGFSGFTFPAPIKHKKTLKQAQQTEQSWWQRRSPEFKAFVTTIGTITGVCLLKYGWLKSIYWYARRDMVSKIRKLINDDNAHCPICLIDKDDYIPDAQLDWCNNCRQFICVNCKDDYKKRQGYRLKCPHCNSSDF